MYERYQKNNKILNESIKRIRSEGFEPKRVSKVMKISDAAALIDSLQKDYGAKWASHLPADLKVIHNAGDIW